MKAVRLHSRGGPEQLAYEDAPLPDPDGYLIEVGQSTDVKYG